MVSFRWFRFDGFVSLFRVLVHARFDAPFLFQRPTTMVNCYHAWKNLKSALAEALMRTSDYFVSQTQYFVRLIIRSLQAVFTSGFFVKYRTDKHDGVVGVDKNATTSARNQCAENLAGEPKKLSFYESHIRRSLATKWNLTVCIRDSDQ